MKSHIMQNVKNLRRERGLTQEQIAEHMKMSTPTYIKMETGHREPTIDELKKLSDVLSVPVDRLINTRPDKTKFEQMLFYILKNTNQNRGVPKTKLAKMLYLADFAYYYENRKSMSGVNYIHKQYGPLADIFLEMIEDLYDNGEIRIDKLSEGAFMVVDTSREQNFTSLAKKEKELIKKICRYWQNATTSEIVNYTHAQKPWRESLENEYIPYKLILDEDKEFIYKPRGVVLN